jgi:hypothetical protein
MLMCITKVRSCKCIFLLSDLVYVLVNDLLACLVIFVYMAE